MSDYESLLFQTFKEVVPCLDYVLLNEKLVILCKDAEFLCDTRVASGLPTLTVSLSSFVNPDALISRLDRLMVMPHHKIIISEDSVSESFCES